MSTQNTRYTVKNTNQAKSKGYKMRLKAQNEQINQNHKTERDNLRFKKGK